MKSLKILLPSMRKCELDKTWREHVVDCIWLYMLGLVTAYFTCDICFKELGAFFVGSILAAGIWVSQWKGHSLLHELLDIRYNWFDHTKKRVFLTVLQLIFYSTISISMVYGSVELVFDVNTGFFTEGGFVGVSLASIGIGTLITLISLSSQFFSNWKKSMVDAEKLKTAHMASQFETLKSQVNPHFLFNSLNVLTNLVYEDQDVAAKFIKQLSVVYRYVLESREKNLVHLSDELEFIKSYIYLQEMRFGESLKVIIDIPKEFMDRELPPLAIQMLLENAIKHNIASKESPLKIQVKIEEDRMVVSNNLQLKNILKEHSSGIGLSNIQERYQFLTNQDVEVVKDQENFTVKLPLASINVNND